LTGFTLFLLNLPLLFNRHSFPPSQISAGIDLAGFPCRRCSSSLPCLSLYSVCLPLSFHHLLLTPPGEIVSLSCPHQGMLVFSVGVFRTGSSPWYFSGSICKALKTCQSWRSYLIAPLPRRFPGLIPCCIPTISFPLSFLLASDHPFHSLGFPPPLLTPFRTRRAHPRTSRGSWAGVRLPFLLR